MVDKGLTHKPKALRNPTLDCYTPAEEESYTVKNVSLLQHNNVSLLGQVSKIVSILLTLRNALDSWSQLVVQPHIVCSGTLLKMCRYYSTTMCHYWDKSVK